MQLFFHETLDFLASDSHEVGDLLARALKCGEYNLKAMEMLDKARQPGILQDKVHNKLGALRGTKGKALREEVDALLSELSVKDVSLLATDEGREYIAGKIYRRFEVNVPVVAIRLRVERMVPGDG